MKKLLLVLLVTPLLLAGCSKDEIAINPVEVTQQTQQGTIQKAAEYSVTAFINSAAPGYISVTVDELVVGYVSFYGTIVNRKGEYITSGTFVLTPNQLPALGEMVYVGAGNSSDCYWGEIQYSASSSYAVYGAPMYRK